MLLLGAADVVFFALSTLILVARADVLTRFATSALVRLGDGVVLALAIATCHLKGKTKINNLYIHTNKKALQKKPLNVIKFNRSLY